MPTKRLASLDFIRGAAIVLVVLHHVLLGLHGDGVLPKRYATYPTWPWIDGVMYAFMFVAGLLAKKQQGSQQWRRIIYLLVISLSGIALYSVFWFTVSSGKTGVEVGHLWFLLYLAAFLGPICVLSPMSSSIVLLIIGLTIHTIGAGLAAAEALRFGSTAIWFSAGVIVGILQSRYNVVDRLQPYILKISILTAIVLMINSVMFGNITSAAKEYSLFGLWRGMLILCALYCCYRLFALIALDRLFMKLGQASLTIYFWHIMFAWGSRKAVAYFTDAAPIIVDATLPLSIIASLAAGEGVKRMHDTLKSTRWLSRNH